MHCVVPENIHTHPGEGHWKFQGGEGGGGGGVPEAQMFKAKYEAKLEFPERRGGGGQTKKPSLGGEWIFSGTTYLHMHGPHAFFNTVCLFLGGTPAWIW